MAFPWEDPATIGQTDEEILAQLFAAGAPPPVDNLPIPPPAPVSPGPPPPIDPALAGAPTVDGLAATPSQEEYDAQIWRELEAQAGGEPPPGVQAAPQAPAAPVPAAQPAPGQQAAQGQPPAPPAEYQPTAYEPETAGAYQAGKVAGLEADRAQVAADGVERQAELGRARMEQMELDRVARAKHLQQTEMRLERERQEILNSKIEENQWWDGQSTGQQLLWMGGGAISGFLDVSLGRGPGHGVVPVMQQLIGKDLEVQKANLANRKDALAEGRSLYAQLMARYQSEEVADNLFMGMALEQEQRNIAGQLAQYESPLAKERGVAAMMEIDDAKRAANARAAAELAKMEYEREIKERELRRQSYEARTGRMNAETNQKQLEIQQQDADTRALTARKTAAGWEVPDGKGGLLHTFRSEAQATEATKMLGAGMTLEALGQQGKKLFANGGWDNNPYSERRAAQNAWIASWVNATKTADGDFSAPNAFDFDSRAPKDNWGPDQIGARIDEQVRTGRAVATTKLRSMGVPEASLKSTGWVDPPDADKTPREAKIVPSGFDDEGKPLPKPKQPTAEENRRAHQELWKAENRKQPDDWKRAENFRFHRGGQPMPWPELGLPR